ncbi:hypothetical protein LS70_001075 [Helicobacter sp. MIT 11-5569]|uniref:hypothetical protein n=1 Tax=Helicobacter sp. MIT 11-5569 TaxID=1548151 RepID=UPI00051FBEC5|nr:hypothetical protein [Helicobacter sp. MIT 11-5569]TLD85173.1 hypothetical protein LS70_001075 [Helicobacter sp. MIT 11-5569]
MYILSRAKIKFHHFKNKIKALSAKDIFKGSIKGTFTLYKSIEGLLVCIVVGMLLYYNIINIEDIIAFVIMFAVLKFLFGLLKILLFVVLSFLFSRELVSWFINLKLTRIFSVILFDLLPIFLATMTILSFGGRLEKLAKWISSLWFFNIF